jgi:hypothetical protein
LYPKINNKAQIYIISLFILILIHSGWAQEDSLGGPFWSPFIKSAIIPGWGQIDQNNSGRAVIYYGLSAYMLYNGIYNHHRFNVTDNGLYKSRSNNFLRLYAQIYAVNLLDVLNTYLSKQYQPWDATMFSDNPIKSPWGAVARSAMLPGWGQLYNDQYIKAVLVLAVVFDFSRKVYVFNHRYEDSGNTAMRDRRVVNTWYLGLIYMLNMVDAYVDATLYRFDETMELTYYVLPMEDEVRLGVSIVF